MSNLVQVFIAKATKLNYGERHHSIKKEFDHYPSIEELQELLQSYDKEHPDLIGLETMLNVEKIYSVVPSETEKPTAFPGWNQIVYGVNPEELNVRSRSTGLPLNHDSPLCTKCESRTALILGNFEYEPHNEPYNNGVAEETNVGGGSCWVGGFKCDKCGLVQGLWHE